MMKQYRSLFFGVGVVLAAVLATAILTDSFLKPLTEQALAQGPVVYGDPLPPAVGASLHWRLAVQQNKVGFITNRLDEPFIAFFPYAPPGPGEPQPTYLVPRPGAVGIATAPAQFERIAINPGRTNNQVGKTGMRIGPWTNDGSAMLFVSGDRYFGDQTALLVRASSNALQQATDAKIFAVEGQNSGCNPGQQCEQWLNVSAFGKVGINVNGAREQLHVNGNVFVEGSNAGVQNGVILRSASGACWKMNVSDTGTVGSVSVPCP